jgi:hypothetical protein
MYSSVDVKITVSTLRRIFTQVDCLEHSNRSLNLQADNKMNIRSIDQAAR